MTVTLLLSLISAALLAVAITLVRDRVKLHTDMNINVTRLMGRLRQGEA